MINLLVWLHLRKMLRVNTEVCEVYIPLAVEVFISCDSPSKINLCHIFYDIVCAL